MSFLHGGNRRAFAAEYGLLESEIIDFSTNINPWGPPDSVRMLYQDSFRSLLAYPDPESFLFKQKIAEFHSISPENVIAGNGATELIYLLVQLLKPRSALLVEPAFAEYRRALNIHHTEIRSVLLKEQNQYSLSLSELLNAARGVELVFLCHPNNPTGSAFKREELVSFLDEMKRRGIFVILDEAFIDWYPEESLLDRVENNASFFILRSLTKFFNLPGVRIGYGVGPRRLVEKLEAFQPAWSVNHLAQILGAEALRDREFQQRSRELMKHEKEFLFRELAGIEELHVFPSQANFFLVKLKTQITSSELTRLLAAEKIMIRDAGNFAGLENHYFRLAVLSRKNNQLLIDALKKIFQKTHA